MEFICVKFFNNVTCSKGEIFNEKSDQYKSRFELVVWFPYSILFKNSWTLLIPSCESIAWKYQLTEFCIAEFKS